VGPFRFEPWFPGLDLEPTGPLLQIDPKLLPVRAHLFERNSIFQAHKTGNNQPNSV
jgi:hypothetical protein